MAEEQDSSSVSTGAAPTFGAAIFAHQFIVKSKKSIKRDEKRLRLQPPGADRAINLRQAILENPNNATVQKAANRSRNWDIIKKKITTAKITDALTNLKFEMNGQKYTVLRTLGEGGYSQVFEVYNSRKDLFALKVVNLAGQSKKAKHDLIREILFLEKLKNCHNVVRAFEYQISETEEGDNRILVLMEKGDKDLSDILEKHREEKTLSPSMLRFYWEQMLMALLEVHTANIIHTDVKPANFLLVAGQLKIIDFGMACELPAGWNYVIRKRVCGTKDYMSPEVFAGMVKEEQRWSRSTIVKDEDGSTIKLTAKSDVWALGIILYRIVYGMLPFSQVPGGKMSKILAMSSLDHPVVFHKKENLDPQLLDTMKRCLEKDPAKRATVDELLVHPYLRPQHQDNLPQSICNNCKNSIRDSSMREKAMARVTYKRNKKASKLVL